jgi:hypothetical protein
MLRFLAGPEPSWCDDRGLFGIVGLFCQVHGHLYITWLERDVRAQAQVTDRAVVVGRTASMPIGPAPATTATRPRRGALRAGPGTREVMEY